MHVSVNDAHHDEAQAWTIGIDVMATVDQVYKEVHDWHYAAFTSDASGRPKDSVTGKIETIRATTADMSGQVRALVVAVTALKQQMDELKTLIQTGGTDPEALDQLVRDAVRTELNATRLTAG